MLFESDLSPIYLEGINATCQNLKCTIHKVKGAVCNEPHLQGDTKHCLMCQSVKENFAIIKIWPGLPGWRCLVWVLWSFRVILPLCVNLSLLSFWSIFMWTSNKWCPPFFLSKLSDCGIMPLACIKKKMDSQVSRKQQSTQEGNSNELYYYLQQRLTTS